MNASKLFFPLMLHLSVFAGLVCCDQATAIQRIGGQQGKGVSAQRVRQAVDQGVAYLKDKRRNGTWNDYRNEGDVTTLVTLALLNAGEPVDDEKMQLTLQYISTQMPQHTLTTYTAALKIMVLEMADPKGKRYLREVEETVEWLVDNQIGRDGGWAYPQGGSSDSSNTQFAILALHAAVKMGVKINPDVWRKAEKYWASCFNRGGGFSYSANGGDPTRLSMACAGIASWIIVQENLSDFDILVKGQKAAACGPKDQMTPVDQTIDLLARSFGVRGNRHADYYYLYALERAGRLSGQRFFGVHDWYRSGSDFLAKRQNKLSGFWRGSSSLGETNPEIATSMALLFLAKGKRPVALGKYQYGTGDQWDNHPKGVHYLTRELETQWQMKLNWQTVRSKDASVDDLLESPVLFISGVDSFQLEAQQKENLRKYIDNGGFILAEACDGEGCGNARGFDRSFRELMAELFPESDLAAIPVDHPLWNAHFSITPNDERPLLGLQACCRTSVVYCKGNLSSYWNLNRPGLEAFVRKNRKNELQDRVDYCSQLGVNVVAYATGRLLRERGDTPTVNEEKDQALLVNRGLAFGKLNHGGGSDEAPIAFKNILLKLKTELPDLDTTKHMVEPEMTQLTYPVIFMHGRTKFSFTDSQRVALGAWLNSGGFLFADSICSNEAFTQSFRKEMKLITGVETSPIPPDHEIWSRKFNGKELREVTLRKRDTGAVGGFSAFPGPPQLEGIEFRRQIGRRVFFARFELCVGEFERQPMRRLHA